MYRHLNLNLIFMLKSNATAVDCRDVTLTEDSQVFCHMETATSTSCLVYCRHIRVYPAHGKMSIALDTFEQSSLGAPPYATICH